MLNGEDVILTELKFSEREKRVSKKGPLGQIRAHEKTLQDGVTTVLVQVIGRNKDP